MSKVTAKKTAPKKSAKKNAATSVGKLLEEAGGLQEEVLRADPCSDNSIVLDHIQRAQRTLEKRAIDRAGEAKKGPSNE